MNTVFIWGAPVVAQKRYVKLTKEIIAYFKKCNLDDVVVFFPHDLMKWDLGKEMAVYVSGSVPNVGNDMVARQAIAASVGLMVKLAFNPEKISCSVLDEPKRGEGYWLHPNP